MVLQTNLTTKMALADVRVVSQGGQNLPPAQTFRVQAAATAIYAGEPVAISGTYVIPLADALPTTASPVFIGIASSNSSQTATTDGTVDVILPVDGLLYEAEAKTPANIATQSQLNALLNTLVAFDLTAGVYTIDESTAAATNGLRIVGGDITKGTITVLARQTASAIA